MAPFFPDTVYMYIRMLCLLVVRISFAILVGVIMVVSAVRWL